VNALAVTINGEPRRLLSPATLLDLLAQLGLDPQTVVVELNREIVRRPRFGETTLADGDTIELVHFVGGG
jgi:thiamine biosynthesis protein ThiS